MITASGAGTSRTASLTLDEVAPAGTLRVVAVLPSPEGDQSQAEAVHVRNLGPTPVTLAGWRIGNGQGAFWTLDNPDGAVAPGQVAIVTRQGRPMALTGFGGTLVLLNPAGETLDTQVYGPATLGQLIRFN